MTSEVLSQDDLHFLLYDWLGVERLCERERYAEHSRYTFDATLALARQIAVERFWPAYAAGDRDEPRFEDGRAVVPAAITRAVRDLADTGLTWAVLPTEHGGSDLPRTVHVAAHAWLQASNIAATAYPALTLGNASLLLTHGDAEQIERYVAPMVDGRFYGTMCLSETEAGSGLADVTTRAVRQDDGTYRLFGTKMWISAGDHEMGENIVHLVLARIDDAPPGVRGLSLFIVPKHLVGADGSVGERNDVALAGLNHKMGYRATTNAVLAFGEGLATPGGAPGAVGHLIGSEGRGLTYMFHMMNSARISVGAGAVALGYAGYRQASEYARVRTQGRPLAEKDPSSPPVPIIAHPDVRRMLLAAKSYVEGGLALVLYAANLVDESRTGPDEAARAEAARLLDVLTPIVKSWPSTYCLAANDLAIQVLGGYGYTREYPVEQLYRDNRLNAIHEGTHGIQGLDLLGRKVVQDGGAGLRLLLDRITATAQAGMGESPSHAAALADAARRVGEVTAALWAQGDPEAALQGAGIYLDAVGHVVLAWLWLEQELAAGARTDALGAGKRAAARYFFTYELPVALARLDTLTAGERLLLDVDEDAL